MPDQGAASNVGTVNITQLPSIDASPQSIVGPGGGPGNPDVTGPGFEDRIPQLMAVDPCILDLYATICGD